MAAAKKPHSHSKRAQAKRLRARKRGQSKRTQRVTGLAVAAGLGFAVATGGTGMAVAADGDGPSAGPSADTDTGSNPTVTDTTTGGEMDVTAPTELATTPERSPGSQTTTTTTGTGPTTSVSSSGGSLTSAEYEEDSESQEESDSEEEVEPEEPDEAEAELPPTDTESEPATTDGAESAAVLEVSADPTAESLAAETLTAPGESAAALASVETLDAIEEEVEVPVQARTMAATSSTTDTTLPEYPEVPGASETQVAIAVVVVLFKALQAALAPIPNPIAIPIFFMLVAAYNRLIDIATNDLPVYSYDTSNPLETVGVLPAIGILGASDPNGDPLTYSVTTGPAGGTVVLDPVNLGTFTYVATSPELIRDGGTDTFVITIDDSGGAADHFYAPNGHTTDVQVTVNVTGTGINIGPSITSPATITNTNTSTGVVTGTVAATDPEGDTITYTGSTLLGTGTVSVTSGGVWTYTPSDTARHNASTLLGVKDDVVTISATDGHLGLPALSSVSVPITPSNESPNPLSIDVSTTGVALGIQSTTGVILGSDPDGDAVNFGLLQTIATDKGGLVTVSPNGSFTYTSAINAGHPASADNATAADKVDTFTVTGYDSFGGSVTTTLSISLIPINSNPTVDLIQPLKNTDSIGVVRGSVGLSDSDGDSLTYSLANASNPAGATTNSTYTSKGAIVALNADGSYTYVPKYSSTGSYSDSFVVSAFDGHGGSKTVTVNVSSVNLSIGTTTTATSNNSESGKLMIPAGDSGLLSYSLGAGPSQGSVVVNADGTYSYTRGTAIRLDSFTVIGTDVNGRQVTVAVVSVSPPLINSAPVAGPTTITNSSLVLLTQTTTGQLSATDVNGDTPLYTSGILPTTVTSTNGAVVTINSDGSFTYSATKLTNYFHDAAKVGSTGTQVNDSFTTTVTDGYGGSTDITVTVPIYAFNSDPFLTAGLRVGNSWTTITKSDIDLGDVVSTPTITKQPQHGSASWNNLLGSLNTSGVQSGDTIELTVTNPSYWKVVNGVAQVGTLSSFTRTFTV